ncbi:hypothetical protein [Methanospirillum hungatei]|uniref:hypothetical protein n=1 Tax=Methanospirillum hungatei TaxID=2203 RepID=UPI0026EEB1F0|nr:hypothetical protein [Methanospirillum hungatei]MCA1917682.1 hypothetical protein [Methanospirillum hungatei]
MFRCVASAKTSISSAPVTEPKTRGFPALMQHGDNPVRIRAIPFSHIKDRINHHPLLKEQYIHRREPDHMPYLNLSEQNS